MSQVKRSRGKEKVIQMGEREGAGLTLSWALPGPRELAKEKGDKGSDHRGRWGDEKTDPTVLNLGIGVVKKGRVLPVHPIGWGRVTAIDCYSPGSLAPAPPLSLLDSCPFPLFIYCTNLSYSPQPEA